MSMLILIALLIVIISVLNEKVFHLQSDIALVLFLSLLSVAGLLLWQVPALATVREFPR